MTANFITGHVHTVFPMGDASRVGEARRHAALLAERVGLGEVEAGRLAIVVNELGNNLVRHATKGHLLLAAREDEVELVSVDSGPGMSDIARHMADGFSTGGTPGTGLGAVRRLTQDLDVHSRAGDGTVIVARVGSGAARKSAHPFRIGGIATAAPGESACGDAWCAQLDGPMASIVLADGLGHGKAAAEASAAMLDVFRDMPSRTARELFQQAHARLRATRGAAVALLQLDGRARTVSCSGAGNVMGRLITGTSDRTLLTQHGTVGVQMRQLSETHSAWPAHAVVIVHSDGIESRWPAQLIAPVLMRDPVIAASLIWRDHCRGRDDATVVIAMLQESS